MCREGREGDGRGSTISWTLTPLDRESWPLLWPLVRLGGRSATPEAWLRELIAWLEGGGGRDALALSCCGGPPLAGALVEWPRPLDGGGAALHLARCWLVEPGRPDTVARGLLAALAHRAVRLGADGVTVAARAGLATRVLAAAGYVPRANGWLLALRKAGEGTCGGSSCSSFPSCP